MESKNFTFLLADDDADETELLLEGLLQLSAQYKLHSVRHADQLMESIKLFRPDIIFMDLALPGLDGRDCLKMLKEDPDAKNIPVIIYSTSGSQDWLKECYDLGASLYFVKPFTDVGLTSGLSEILKKYESNHLFDVPFEEFLLSTDPRR